MTGFSVERDEDESLLLQLLSLLSLRLLFRFPKRWMLKRFFFFRFLASYTESLSEESDSYEVWEGRDDTT